MKNRKSLANVISIIYIVTIALHFFGLLFYFNTSFFSPSILLLINLSTLFGTFIFSLMAFSKIILIINSYKNQNKIKNYSNNQQKVVRISRITYFAIKLWISSIIFDLFFTVFSSYISDYNFLIILKNAFYLKEDDIFSIIYFVQCVLFFSILLITLTNFLLTTYLAKTYEFVFNSSEQICFNFILFDQISFILLTAGFSTLDLTKREISISLKKQEDDILNINKDETTELLVFCIKNQILKEAKKGLTPPDFLKY